MNIAVSIFNHNASCIGKEAIERVQRNAARISQIDFASFLTDTDALALALFASDLSLSAPYAHLPDTDWRKQAAEKATRLRDPIYLSRQLHAGFFLYTLYRLVEIGNANSDHGAKLVPVFAYMLENKAKYCLGSTLVNQIQRLFAKRGFVDGYLMINQTAATCCVIPLVLGKEVA